MAQKTYVIGFDFGSDSARALITETTTGAIVGEGVSYYTRWKNQLYCIPSQKQFRQHPLDYLETLENSISIALVQAGDAIRKKIIGIGFDATASTPTPIDKEGTPLALTEQFKENPDAMFYLWKDHTATEEAEEITRVFSSFGFTAYQGPYQSEWYWAKVLHCTKVSTEVIHKAYSWIELCDWLPSILAGIQIPKQMYRCSCAAGHKVYYNSTLGGMPSKECLDTIHPYLSQIAATYRTPQFSGTKVGLISKKWAKRLNLPPTVVIGGSACDAHAGAVGAGIKPRTLIKILGTSAVDILVESLETITKQQIQPTVCGMAENSVLYGYYGMETGQAAFGDMNSWFKQLLLKPLQPILNTIQGVDQQNIQKILSHLDAKLLPSLEERLLDTNDNSDIMALDWFNGRRYPNLHENLQGAIVGLNFGIDAARLYRALVLSTVFGAKRIFQNYIDSGIVIDKIIAIGGISQKSPYTVQLLCDVLNRPIQTLFDTQVCARGAAIFAAVASGIYPTLQEAQKRICIQDYTLFEPRIEKVPYYERLYQRYLQAGAIIETLY